MPIDFLHILSDLLQSLPPVIIVVPWRAKVKKKRDAGKSRRRA